MHADVNDEETIRRRAEARLQAEPPRDGPPSADSLARLVHELQVHQIELEIQNEELQNTQAELKELLDRYTDLYDFAPVGYLTLMADGTISQANLTCARLLHLERTHLLQKSFNSFVAESARHRYAGFLRQVFESGTLETCTLKLVAADQLQMTIQLEAIRSNDEQECRAIVTDVSERVALEEALAVHRDNLDEKVADKTEELRRTLSLMVGRESRMAGLKNSVKRLRQQLIAAGIEPCSDDPIFEDR